MGRSISLSVVLLLFTAIVSCELFAADISAHGYFRTRSAMFQDLDAQRPTGTNNSRFGLVQYNQMRFRIEPSFKLNDYLSLHASADFLDNVLYGTNTDQLGFHSPLVGTVTLPAGAGSLSSTGGTAGANAAANFRRIWADILTPVGRIRVGRQPVHWGLGILQNDGNEQQGDFGDTADRVMFTSQMPVANGDLVVSGIWDIAYEAQRDPRIGGLASAIADNGQDHHMFGAQLLYKEEKYSLGMFAGLRHRSGSNGNTTTAIDAAGISQNAGIDGDTNLYFVDLYGQYKFGIYNFEMEYAYLGGKMSTGVAVGDLPFSALSSGEGIIELPAKQTVQTQLMALEVNARHEFGGEWEAKVGFAQGDTSPLSGNITQIGFRPDYQIGLLMFNEPLGTSPTVVNASDGSKVTGGVPITGNFINNTYYFSGTYKHHFDISESVAHTNDFAIGGRIVTGFAQAKPISADFSALLSNTSLPNISGNGKWYGAELDLIAEGRFFDNFYAGFDFGILFPGAAYDINVNQSLLGSNVNAITTSNAGLVYGGKFTLVMTF